MSTVQCEGMVLQATPYQDHHHIISIFSQTMGVVRCFVRGTIRPRHHSHALVTPLVRGDFLLQNREGTLFRLQDGRVTEPYLGLRDRSDRLQAACKIARALIGTQLPGKPAPALYQLATAYFDQLNKVKERAEQLLSSFYLKLMRHEGVLPLSAICCACDQEATPIHLASAGPYCPKCAPAEALPFLPTEWSHLERLAMVRSFAELLKEASPPLFEQKVKKLFDLLT